MNLEVVLGWTMVIGVLIQPVIFLVYCVWRMWYRVSGREAAMIARYEQEERERKAWSDYSEKILEIDQFASDEMKGDTNCNANTADGITTMETAAESTEPKSKSSE